MMLLLMFPLERNVGMYKRLYEEDIKTQYFLYHSMKGDGMNDLQKFVNISQEIVQNMLEQYVEQIRHFK
jgi:hypothetical protein